MSAPVLIPISDGVSVNVVTKISLMGMLDQALRDPRGQLFVPIYAALARTWARDPSFAADLSAAHALYPDGMGVVFSARLRSSMSVERLAMTDLFFDFVSRAVHHARPLVLIGGTEEVNDAAASAARAAGADVLWHTDGYEGFDFEGTAVRLADSQAALVFVGLGAGLQERFCHAAVAGGARHVFATCGGLFDHVSGRRHRAPGWVQVTGLEWLWRTAQEPRRLLWRYAAGNAFFIRRALLPAMRERMRGQER